MKGKSTKNQEIQQQDQVFALKEEVSAQQSPQIFKIGQEQQSNRNQFQSPLLQIQTATLLTVETASEDMDNGIRTLNYYDVFQFLPLDLKKAHQTLNSQPFLVYESINMAKFAIDLLINEGGILLYDTYIQGKIASYLSNEAIHVIHNIQINNIAEKDEGEKDVIFSPLWQEEQEETIIKATIDTWGALTLKSTLKIVDKASSHIRVDSQNDFEDAVIGDNKSQIDDNSKQARSKMHSRVSSAAGVNKSQISMQSWAMSSSNSMRKYSAKGKQQNYREDKKDLVEYQVQKLFQPELSLDDKKKIVKMESTEDEIRFEKDKKKREKLEEIEMIRKRAEEELIQKDEQHKKQQQLKNKTYTYDFEGNVLLTHNLQFGNFPNEIQTMKYEYLKPPVVVKQAYQRYGINITGGPFQNQVQLNKFTFEQQPQQLQTVESLQNQKEQKQQTKQNGKRGSIAGSMKGGMHNKVPLSIISPDLNPYDENVKYPPDDNMFQPHPPLQSIFTPREGVVIKYDNGIRQEGEHIKALNRMRKSQFEQMVNAQMIAQGGKVASYVQDTNQTNQDQMQQQKDILLQNTDNQQEAIIKYDPRNPASMSKLSEAQRKNLRIMHLKDVTVQPHKFIQIHEQEMFIKMMQTEVKRENIRPSTTSSKGTTGTHPKRSSNPVKINDEEKKKNYDQGKDIQGLDDAKQQKAKHKLQQKHYHNARRVLTAQQRSKNNKYERITTYHNVLDVNINDSLEKTIEQLKQLSPKVLKSKVHEIVKGFNNSEIINNQNWGIANKTKQEIVRPTSALLYKEKRLLKSPGDQKNMRVSQKILNQSIFPTVKKPPGIHSYNDDNYKYE